MQRLYNLTANLNNYRKQPFDKSVATSYYLSPYAPRDLTFSVNWLGSNDSDV